MRKLQIYFLLVIIVMLAVTVRASLDENVISAAVRLARDPWGAATLADAYFGFIAFYLWIFYKEPRAWPRILWLLAILILGNFAMAAYVLLQIRRMDAKGDIESLITKRN